jgi:hypothetical protein
MMIILSILIRFSEIEVLKERAHTVWAHADICRKKVLRCSPKLSMSTTIVYLFSVACHGWSNLLPIKYASL